MVYVQKCPQFTARVDLIFLDNKIMNVQQFRYRCRVYDHLGLRHICTHSSIPSTTRTEALVRDILLAKLGWGISTPMILSTQANLLLLGIKINKTTTLTDHHRLTLLARH